MVELVYGTSGGHLVRLLNTALVYPRAQRDRLWVKSGCVMMLNESQSIRLMVDRVEDYEYVPVAVLETSCKNGSRSRELDLGESSCLDLSLEHGLVIVPRAMEFNPDGRPFRLFIELVQTDQRYRQAV